MDNASLRKLIDRKIISDVELSEFLIDYYPNIYRQTSSGMSRTEKVNILLSIEYNKESLLKNINQYINRSATIGRQTSRVGLLTVCAILLVFSVLPVMILIKDNNQNDRQKHPYSDIETMAVRSESAIVHGERPSSVLSKIATAPSSGDIAQGGKPRPRPIIPGRGHEENTHKYHINGNVQINSLKTGAAIINQNNTR
ncbi:MAG: hypothetical protein JNJ46_25455 [Myxococcales bacterium]|nr:hypothetical protein [Myxococcales bacterium]